MGFKFKPFFNDKLKKETSNWSFLKGTQGNKKEYSSDKLHSLIIEKENNKKNTINLTPECSSENKDVTKTLRVKLYPDSEQKRKLLTWLDHARFTYNLSLEKLNENNKLEYKELCREIVSAKHYFCPECNEKTGRVKYCKKCETKTIQKINESFNRELSETPKHIRSSMVKNLYTNFKTNFKKLKNKTITHFQMQFKSRKKLRSDSIELDKKFVKINITNAEVKLYSMKVKLQKKEKKSKFYLPDIKFEDPKINYNYRTKEFYLCLPCEDYTDYCFRTKKTIALDPGVKTFLTGYDSSNGNSIQFNNRIELLERLKKKISSMQSRQVNKQKIQKHYRRITNIINDTHWRFVTYLTRNYDEIILPHFESQEMKKENCHSFNEKLLNFNRFYQFSQKLEWKCRYLNKTLTRMNESFTTKTCGSCGKLNEKMTIRNRIFNCVDESCQMQNIDRDYHAARNIFLKTKFC
jgi:putative transposase